MKRFNRKIAHLLFTALVLCLANETFAAQKNDQKNALKDVQTSGKKEKVAKTDKTPTRKISSSNAEQAALVAYEHWQHTIEKSQAGDSQAFKFFLDGMKDRQGLSSAEYSMDLMKIFAVQPTMVIIKANDFFGGNLNCLAYWLIPDSQEVSFGEVQAALNQARAKNPTHPKVKEFSQIATAYHEAMTSNHPIAVTACARYFFTTSGRHSFQ